MQRSRGLLQIWTQKHQAKNWWGFQNMATAQDPEVVSSNLKFVADSISDAVARSGSTRGCRLVAVSKTKPVEMIKACFAAGQRHFGENYVQELEEKSAALSNDWLDIKWHYIGQIQSNKIGKICSCPGLFCVETISSEKHCTMFNKEMEKIGKVLDVLVQVNTSSEDQKGGISPSDAPRLAAFIRDSCPHLRFAGFMTIGSFDHSHVVPNPDFDRLSAVRKSYAAEAGKPEHEYDLSMGMSDDYLTAIQQGSTSVRVGSKIFGPRLYKET